MWTLLVRGKTPEHENVRVRMWTHFIHFGCCCRWWCCFIVFHWFAIDWYTFMIPLALTALKVNAVVALILLFGFMCECLLVRISCYFSCASICTLRLVGHSSHSHWMNNTHTHMHTRHIIPSDIFPLSIIFRTFIIPICRMEGEGYICRYGLE